MNVPIVNLQGIQLSKLAICIKSFFLKLLCMSMTFGNFSFLICFAINHLSIRFHLFFFFLSGGGRQ